MFFIFPQPVGAHVLPIRPAKETVRGTDEHRVRRCNLGGSRRWFAYPGFEGESPRPRSSAAWCEAHTFQAIRAVSVSEAPVLPVST